MASNSTPNVGLNQWLADDPVLREDFNADNLKLDTALASLGNCRIYSGRYTGTGTVGADAPCHLELGFKPLVLFMDTTRRYDDNGHAVWICPQKARSHVALSNMSFEITWEETGVSWYLSGSNSYLTPANQLNEAGTEYSFLALGYLP